MLTTQTAPRLEPPAATRRITPEGHAEPASVTGLLGQSDLEAEAVNAQLTQGCRRE